VHVDLASSGHLQLRGVSSSGVVPAARAVAVVEEREFAPIDLEANCIKKA